MSSAERDLQRKQEPLLQAVAVLDAAGARELAGFGGISISIPESRVDLYWSGALDESMERALVQARSLAEVRLHAAAYTERRLLQAQQALIADPSVPWTRVSPKPDGSGLIMAVESPSSAIATRAADIAGVPVELVTGSAATDDSAVG